MKHTVDVFLPKMNQEREFLYGNLQWDRTSTLI